MSLPVAFHKINKSNHFFFGNQVLNSIEKILKKDVGAGAITALMNNVLTPIADDNRGAFRSNIIEQATALRWQAWHRLAQLGGYPKSAPTDRQFGRFIANANKELANGQQLGISDAAIFSSLELRPTNQDAALLAKQNGILLAVADGLGGHPRGEITAPLALETLAGVFAAPEVFNLPGFSFPAAFHCVAMSLFGEPTLQQHRMVKPKTAPGTTLTAVHLLEGQATIAHLGDSRAYLIRNSELSILTPDDGGMLAFIKSEIGPDGKLNSGWLGHLAPFFRIEYDELSLEPFIAWTTQNRQFPPFPLSGELAASYYYLCQVFNFSNVLEKYLGTAIVSQPYCYSFSTVPGDIILLATDGFNKLSLEQLNLTLDLNRRNPIAILLNQLYDAGTPFRDNFTLAAIRL